MHRPALLLVALLALVTACSSSDDDPRVAAPTRSQPAESAFADGTCRAAAPDVLAVGRDADRLPEDAADGKVPADVKDALRESQDRLFALAETAEPTRKPVLDQLVVAIGLVRVRADGNTYEPALGRDLLVAYDAVVTACTTP